MEWSHDLLTAAEKMLFRRLSVFADGFSLTDLQEVCLPAWHGLSVEPALEVMESLVAKNLLERVTVAERSRFRMLETVRLYARARLAASGEAEQISMAHARRFGQHLSRADDRLHGPDLVPYLRWFLAEVSNIRACLTKLWDRGEYALVADLVSTNGWSWTLCGLGHHGREWFERITGTGLVAVQQEPLAYAWAGMYANLAGRYDDAAALTAVAEDAAAAAGAVHPGSGQALFVCAVDAHWRGDDESAHRRWLLSRKLSEPFPDSWSYGYSLRGLGLVAPHVNTDPERESELFQESLSLARAASDGLGVSYTLRNWASSSLHRGNLEAAGRLAIESLPHFSALRDEWSIALVAEQLSIVAQLHEGDALRAARLLGGAERIRGEFGTPVPRSEISMTQDARAKVRGALGEAFEPALDQGHGMTTDPLLAYAGRETAAVELARMDRSVGALDSACAAYERAMQDARNAADSAQIAAVGHAFASALLERGDAADSAEALRLLDEARSAARGAGQLAFAERIGVERRGMEPPMANAAGLTAREGEVLALVARGLTNQEIGHELYISASTVANHLGHVYAKAGVANRAEATAFALRTGSIADRAG